MRTISKHLSEVAGIAMAKSDRSFMIQSPPKPKLSEREKEVLRFIGLGYSIKEISKILFLSKHTVTTHRNSIKHKYRCRKSAQLAVLADRLGLLADLKFAT